MTGSATAATGGSARGAAKPRVGPCARPGPEASARVGAIPGAESWGAETASMATGASAAGPAMVAAGAAAVDAGCSRVVARF